ncbi:hemerythrin domain-containing protein [Intrasporangium sp.]|uniref:hemerythrin domain-containing protein n=1 Tax=Intrasporangium sp. TaxID=1925024 RepID=UPI00293A32BA|nr:hemerythrin domain-containing protein [Intrasporangium sp.]MDV3222228.1 hemerythrin domain-containing protein [Intrasporangium sp.]
MSTTTGPSWPTQITLPGQTAAHPGPVDMTMMYVMHHAFRRDLTAFAAAAASTPVADRTSWQALAERWGVFSQCLHHHHSGEDAGIWPLLMGRADAAQRETLEAMEGEHAEIDPILTACAAGFTRLAEHADEDARAALAVRLAAARESLGRHLRHEETDAIRIIQEHMTNAEWHALDEEYFKQGVSFRQVLAIVPWILHGLPVEARESLFTGPGGRLHRVLWLATKGQFDRREKVAFRYVS